MDEYDDEDGPAFPHTVTIAGWLWFVHGTGWLLVTFLAGGAMAADPTGGIGLAVAAGGLAFGLFLMGAGVDAVQGAARDVIWPARVTSVLGAILLAGVVLWSVLLSIDVFLVLGAPVIAFLASGLLALHGRGAYLRWRAAVQRTDPGDGTHESRP